MYAVEQVPPPATDHFGAKGSATLSAAKSARDQAVSALGSAISQASDLVKGAAPIQDGLRQVSATERAYRQQGDLAKALEDVVVAAVFSKKAQNAFWNTLQKSPKAQELVDKAVQSLKESIQRSQEAQSALKAISFSASGPAQLAQLKAQVEAAKSRAKQAISSAQSSIARARDALHAGIEIARSIRVVMKDVLHKAHRLTYQQDGDKRRSDALREAGSRLRAAVKEPKEALDKGVKRARAAKEELPKMAKGLQAAASKIEAIKIPGGSKNVTVSQPTGVVGDIVLGVGIGAAILVGVTLVKAMRA